MAIPVKLPVFEGPLDLLLHLIEKNKIDIYDIPIVQITDQYLDYVRQMEREDMDVMSEFLVMAATLLDIKSRMLLPREKNEETGEEEGDPREELVQRLLEYKMYKYLSEELAVCREQAGVRFFRAQNLPQEVRSYQPPIDYEDLLGSADLKSLQKVFGEVLRRKKNRRDPVRSGFGKISREEVNIDTKTLYIRAYLQAHPRIDFRDLLESRESREEVIVTFLILLELMKHQKVHIEQDAIGGKILVVAGKLSEDTEDGGTDGLGGNSAESSSGGNSPESSSGGNPPESSPENEPADEISPVSSLQDNGLKDSSQDSVGEDPQVNDLEDSSRDSVVEAPETVIGSENSRVDETGESFGDFGNPVPDGESSPDLETDFPTETVQDRSGDTFHDGNRALLASRNAEVTALPGTFFMYTGTDSAVDLDIEAGPSMETGIDASLETKVISFRDIDAGPDAETSTEAEKDILYSQSEDVSFESFQDRSVQNEHQQAGDPLFRCREPRMRWRKGWVAHCLKAKNRRDWGPYWISSGQAAQNRWNRAKK